MTYRLHLCLDGWSRSCSPIQPQRGQEVQCHQGARKRAKEIIDKLHKRWHIRQDHTLPKPFPALSPRKFKSSSRAGRMGRSKCGPALPAYLHCSLTVPPVSQDPRGCPCLCPEPRLFPSPDLSVDSLMKTWGKWLLFGYPHLETNAHFCSP